MRSRIRHGVSWNGIKSNLHILLTLPFHFLSNKKFLNRFKKNKRIKILKPGDFCNIKYERKCSLSLLLAQVTIDLSIS